jgi:hypothetical protein
MAADHVLASVRCRLEYIIFFCVCDVFAVGCTRRVVRSAQDISMSQSLQTRQITQFEIASMHARVSELVSQMAETDPYTAQGESARRSLLAAMRELNKKAARSTDPLVIALAFDASEKLREEFSLSF